ELQDCFIVGEKFRSLADESPVPIQRLTEYPLIFLEKKSNTRLYLNQWLKSIGVELEPEIELGNLDLMLQFARLGLGVSCAIRNFIREELDNGIVFEVKTIETIPPRYAGVAYLKSVPLSPVAARFLKLLIEE
ncbi:MAG TPA: LysR family transcriptional regulator, partial [Clostridiales bacterium]|nr:LysR family transcriptional regulator [Clostridiales bacterium]